MGSNMNSSATRSAPQAKPCAVCGKPQVERLRPFCSRRCADVDLHRWLSGAYALPAGEDEDGEAFPAGPEEGHNESPP
jgi:endogenous inhibitor of DNA gyrase (YacG/DUF329 family)